MTYLFSENRQLENIQDGDVVVNDCEDRSTFSYHVFMKGFELYLRVDFDLIKTEQGVAMYTAKFSRIKSYYEPQTAPDMPVPCRSN